MDSSITPLMVLKEVMNLMVLDCNQIDHHLLEIHLMLMASSKINGMLTETNLSKKEKTQAWDHKIYL